jgi:hypothetical protein
MLDHLVLSIEQLIATIRNTDTVFEMMISETKTVLQLLIIAVQESLTTLVRKSTESAAIVAEIFSPLLSLCVSCKMLLVVSLTRCYAKCNSDWHRFLIEIELAALIGDLNYIKYHNFVSVL